MLWKKPSNLKYTDLCIYIDEHVPAIAEPGKDPVVEDKVYNYLWLVVKALAIKKRMFDSFQDYDGYSFYAAERLFFALRKNYTNQGKIVKGKLIRPIKSCLNYMKAIMYPMKIEYQRLSYRTVIAEEWVSKSFDSFQYKEQLKEEARQSSAAIEQAKYYLIDTLKHCGTILDNLMDTTPYTANSVDRQHLKITVLLNCYRSLKTNHKFDTKLNNLVLWKLPKSMTGYVKLFLNKFYTKIKEAIIDCFKVADLDDLTLNKMISVQKEYLNVED